MRRFGVELEMLAPPASAHNALNAANDLINGLGIRSQVASYTGRNYAVYQCKSDASIRPQERGVEVVSPIFPANPDSYETVRRVVTALDAQGFTVNSTTGMHVHINVSDLPLRTRMLVVLRYNQIQDQLNRMLPRSRRANGYCAALHDRAGLERAINTGRTDWRRNEGRASESVNTAFLHDTDARLEFRQAAGTTEHAKVINWITYLQEMIDEVARRAAGATFAAPMTATAPVRPLRPALPTVPRMHSGSDASRALNVLCTTGVITSAWATENGIPGPVLRRIVVGFRRHGAGLQTVSTGNGPDYHLRGVAQLPCLPRDVFAVAPAVVAPVAPVAPPVAPAVATTTAAELVAYDFFAGHSEPICAWLRDRFDTFASDFNPTI